MLVPQKGWESPPYATWKCRLRLLSTETLLGMFRPVTGSWVGVPTGTDMGYVSAHLVPTHWKHCQLDRLDVHTSSTQVFFSEDHVHKHMALKTVRIPLDTHRNV